MTNGVCRYAFKIGDNKVVSWQCSASYVLAPLNTNTWQMFIEEHGISVILVNPNIGQVFQLHP